MNKMATPRVWKDEGDKTDKGTNDQPRTNQLHPLKNPLILGIIVNQLSDNKNDLKNFRLVCTHWRDSLPNTWKSQHKIWTIHQKKTSLKNTHSATCHWTLSQFKKTVMADRSLIPENTFIKMELHSWNMEQAYLSLSRKHGFEYWLHSTFHSRISHVMLTNCQFPGNTTVFSETFLASFPNLSTLVVIKPEISIKAWEEIYHTFHTRRIYYEHEKLEKFALEMKFTNYQFEVFWLTFQRSLPKLKEISIKRLVESHQGYDWVEFLFQRLNSEKLAIHLEEVSTCFKFQEKPKNPTFCIDTAPTELYNEFAHMRGGRTITFVAFKWEINCKDGQLRKSAQSWFPFERYNAKIVELRLTGQIFESLCFLKNLNALRKIVWQPNRKDLGEEEIDTKKGKQNYSLCGFVQGWWGHEIDKVEILVDPDIEIKNCNC